MTEETEAVGATCLYKDGDAQTFEGDDVAQAMTEGWKDAPNAPVESPAAGEPSPADSMPGASEAAPAPSVG